MENQEALNTQLLCILNNASIQYRTEEYQLATSSYSQALTDISDSLVFQSLKTTLLSLKASSLEKQERYDEALDACNQALVGNRTHELSLLRRSKMYLKTGEVEKGLRDLELFIQMAPDMEIDSLLNRFDESIDGLEQSEEKYNFKKRISQLKVKDDEDEELFLSFCNLKLIDRQSRVVQGKSKGKPKKESVYFGEESICQIEVQDTNEDQKQNQGELTEEMVRSKIEEQRNEEMEYDSKNKSEFEDQVFRIKSTHENDPKPILKTQTSSIKIPSILQIDSIISEPASAIDILRIKNIDGKFVQKTKSEIRFRRSQFVPNTSHVKSRKSILKIRKSDIVEGFAKRKSKLESIVNIDGRALYTMSSHKDIGKSNRSLDSEEEFNIYGDSKISEEEVNNFVSNWFQASVSQVKSTTSSRKSAMKPKNSMRIQNKEGKRRTVLFNV